MSIVDVVDDVSTIKAPNNESIESLNESDSSNSIKIVKEEPEWRERLLGYLKRPDSTALLKALKFLLNILKDVGISLDRKSIACQHFYRDIEVNNDIKECLESYIMTKYYDILFTIDKDLENAVRRGLELNGDVMVDVDVNIEDISSSLKDLSSLVLPLDMLNVIKKWISTMGKGELAMDSLIPFLLGGLKLYYCGPNASNAIFFSTIKYIERFRCSSAIIGESSFSLTTSIALYQLIMGKEWISPPMCIESPKSKFDPIKSFIEFVPRIFNSVSDSFKKEVIIDDDINGIRNKVMNTNYDLLDDSLSVSEVRFILRDYKNLIQSINK